MTAVRVGLGPRLQEEGLGRLSREAGKSSKARLGQGGEGRLCGGQVRRSGSRNYGDRR